MFASLQFLREVFLCLLDARGFASSPQAFPRFVTTCKRDLQIAWVDLGLLHPTLINVANGSAGNERPQGSLQGVKGRPFMINVKIEQKSFLGKPERVLGNVVAYIEELKGIFEAEVYQGLGFGLIFYQLKEGGGDVVVLKSNRTVHDLDSFQCVPPLVVTDKLQDWNRALNILRDWKYVEPSAIIYGWKQKHSFTFSHSMAIPTMTPEGSSMGPGKVVECLIFNAVTPGGLPFVLIDGALAPPRGNALCTVQAAPEEKLLYSSLKSSVEEDSSARFHLVKAMLRSKRPAVLLQAFKYLQQMKCPQALYGMALEACVENIASNNDRLLEAMERALFLKPLTSPGRIAPQTGGKNGAALYPYMHDDKPSRRRIAARFYLSAEQYPDSAAIERLARDPDPAIRQWVAEKLAARVDDGPEVKLLWDLLADPCPEVRVKAVKALAVRPTVEIYGKLAVLLQDPDAAIRTATVEAFAHESASPWVEQLIAMLEEPSSEVFAAAARALRYAGSGRHVPLLKEIHHRQKAQRGVHGSLSELEWTILALEGNISELEKMKESCGPMFSRVWISPVIRRAREIQQQRQRHQSASDQP